MPAIDLQKMLILAKKKIIFTDEVHLDLGGYVSKQNCCIFGTENPHAYIEKVSWTFFFDNEQGEGDRYRAIFNEFLFTKFEEEDIGNIWFQQDGATCHISEATLDVLRPVFEDRIISGRADDVWPPRSSDMTPLDYYLWGVVKDKCSPEKPETINALKYNIREAIR